MAIQYMTGWELGSTAPYTNSAAQWNGNGAINTTAGFLHRSSSGVGGNYSILLDDNWYCAPGTLPLGTARWLHYWSIPGNAGYSSTSLQMSYLGNTQAQINFLGNGTIAIYRGGTLILTVTNAYIQPVAHWWAIEMVLQTSSGIINIYCDDKLVASYLGNTQGQAGSGWDAFGWGNCYNGGSVIVNNFLYVDDVMVTDNTTGKLKEQHVLPLTPNADTAQADFTPSTGTSHFALVDEIPPSDVDYNSTVVSGAEDRYAFTDLPSITSVTAVQVTGRATRDGALTQGQVSLKSGGTVVYSTAVTLPASPTYVETPYVTLLDPNTGVAWTAGAVNALEAGFKFTT